MSTRMHAHHLRAVVNAGGGGGGAGWHRRSCWSAPFQRRPACTSPCTHVFAQHVSPVAGCCSPLVMHLLLMTASKHGWCFCYFGVQYSFGLTLQWGELSKRPQAGVGGMPDLALQLRVSKNALRSPAFQEEIVSQVSFCFCCADQSGDAWRAVVYLDLCSEH